MTAKVYHLDLYGTREEKYEWLRTHTLADLRPADASSFQKQDAPPAHHCRGLRCPCRRACGDVFTGRRTFRRADGPKKRRQGAVKETRYSEPRVFGPMDPALFPNAVLVPADVYQGLHRTLHQILMIVGAHKWGDASLAVQVADTLHQDAAAMWIRENLAEFRRGCGAGFVATSA